MPAVVITELVMIEVAVPVIVELVRVLVIEVAVIVELVAIITTIEAHES